MLERIYTVVWIQLPRDVREYLAGIFGISRSGISEVRDQTIISDGFTNEDLESITKEKLEEYVGATADFARLWNLAVAKAGYELHPPVRKEEKKELIEEPTEEDVKTKKSKQV